MTICGLDFGTSNSTIGVLDAEQAVMVPLEKDGQGHWQTTLPSALFFAFDDDHISFGREAIGRYTQGESGRLMRSMKSIMGSTFMSDGTQIKRRLYSYEEIIGFFVSSLKQRAESFLTTDRASIDSVVMGRPVFFNDDDAELDRAAEDHLANIAKAAGFKHVSFQYEPIAAALHYEKAVTSEELALIIDIGGGTSDFTIVRLSNSHNREARQGLNRREDFLANHGIHIGGTDFDRRLSIAAVMGRFGMREPLADRPNLEMPGHFYHELATWHRIHLLYEQSVLRDLKSIRITLRNKEPIDRLIALLDNRRGHQLAEMVESAKIDLSTQEQAILNLPELLPEYDNMQDCMITSEQLQDSLHNDIERIFIALDDTLKQAGLNHRQIDTVFTTGGSTALPVIKEWIKGIFSAAKVVEGDLYNSVGSGLLQEAINRYR